MDPTGGIRRLAGIVPAIYRYVSPPREADHRFNALGLHWDGDLPAGATLSIELRASEDGERWDGWQPVGPLDAIGDDARDTEPLLLSGRYFQYRLTLESSAIADKPHISEVRVTYIDSTQGSPMMLAAVARPPVILRGGWGADENQRYVQGKVYWPPEYEPARKVIVHHTATANREPDWAAAVRAIYYYHAVTQDWGDIGYNFLIDPQGRVYEGRAGGPNVVAAHAFGYNRGTIGVALLGNFEEAGVPGPAMETLQNLVLNKVIQHGIDPIGHGLVGDVDLPNIFAHRDVLPTLCPGVYLYPRVPFIRAAAWNGLPAFTASWSAHSMPPALLPGARLRVAIEVKNVGLVRWEPAGASAVQLSYRWLRADGAPVGDVRQARFPMPRAVSPGETVTVPAEVEAPSLSGRFILSWDLVRGENGWFVGEGSHSLDVQVSVTAHLGLPGDRLVLLTNEELLLLPSERLGQLPLSRLGQLRNEDLAERLPELLPLLPNGRLLSFGNQLLLRFLSDERLKALPPDRISTFPRDVQLRLAVPPARPP